MKKLLLVVILISLSYCNAQTGNRDSIKNRILKDNEDTTRVKDLANLSFEYIDSNPDTVMIMALQALSISNRIGFEKGRAMSLNRIGNVYGSLGNYSKSIETYLQALKINEKINNLDGKQRNFNNIGNLYRTQEDYRLALNYLSNAKSLAELIGSSQSICISSLNIAITYDSMHVFDSANLYADQAYHIAIKNNYMRQIGLSLNMLGHIHFSTGRNMVALEYYRSSIPYIKLAKSDITLSETFLNLAKLFHTLNQQDSAFFFGKRSLFLAQQRHFTAEVRDAASFLSFYYRTLHNPDSALIYQDISKAANDSLFSKQKQNQFQSLAFDEKLRQQEIAASEIKEKEERSRNLQYAAIAIGLITFVILFLLLSHSIIANQKLIRFFGVVALLMVFEFINLYIHPYLANATNDSPFLMLLVMVCIASLLVPVHHWLEKWITHQLVEKNNKIRLAAAKKIIASLEPKNN